MTSLPIIVATSSAACSGSTPESAHPRVFLDLSKKHSAICPYCSQEFQQQDHLDESQKANPEKTRRSAGKK